MSGVTVDSEKPSGAWHMWCRPRTGTSIALCRFCVKSSKAPVIAIGQQIIGMIESSTDRDWIGAHLTAGQKYRATASGSYGNINGRTFAITIDLKAAIYNQDVTRLSPGDAFTMEPGDDLNSGRVVSATSASGLHFFEVIRSDRTGRTRGAYYFTITQVSQ